MRKRNDSPIISDARAAAAAADVQFVVALIAHTAAKRTAFDTADDDTRTCVVDAEGRYRAAAALYVRTARLYHSPRTARADRHDASRFPIPLRTTLRRTLDGMPHETTADAAPLPVGRLLDQLQQAVLSVRAVVIAALPMCFEGRDHPLRQLEDLRQGLLPHPSLGPAAHEVTHV
jgi:hypothetical protein